VRSSQQLQQRGRSRHQRLPPTRKMQQGRPDRVCGVRQFSLHGPVNNRWVKVGSLLISHCSLQPGVIISVQVVELDQVPARPGSGRGEPIVLGVGLLEPHPYLSRKLTRRTRVGRERGSRMPWVSLGVTGQQADTLN
jgi:hypothetical protein